MSERGDDIGERLRHRVAIVTGASQGIGRGIAVALAEKAVSVTLTARTITNLDETGDQVASAGGRTLVVPCDVRDPDAIANVVARTVGEFGRLDIVVNNAQTIRYAFLMDSTPEDVSDAWRSGPVAAYHFMRLAFPYLSEHHGVVVNVGSSSTHLADTARYGIYNGVKRALEELARAAHHEWKPQGVSAFTIHPAAESAMTMNWKARDPEKYAAAVAAMPGGRLGDPLEDVGRPLVPLIAHSARYSGRTIHLDAAGPRETTESISERPVEDIS